jgi:N-methylhydantoinase B
MTIPSAQIIYGQISALVREMTALLPRLSRSPLVTEDRAFAVGLLDTELNLIAQEQGDPSHLYAVRDTGRVVLDYYAYDVAEGDVFVVADPFFGGTHGHVLSILRPLFWKGALVYLVVVRIPVLDLAGELPGAYQPFAFEVWQEAYRLTPMRLFRAGALQKDVARFLSVNSRAPASLHAEIEAVLAVCRSAESGVHRLIHRYGLPTLRAAQSAGIDYTAVRLREHLDKILARPGEARRTVRDPSGSTLHVDVKVSRHESAVMLDFTGSSNVMQNSLNATPALCRAAAILPLIAAVLDDLPFSEGVLRAFDFVLPAGTVVNAAAPAASSLTIAVTAHVIAAAVTAAARNAGASADEVPSVHGLAPIAVLYTPVGTSEVTIPLYLSPGFCIGPTRLGGAAWSGSRVLVSAEELELRHGCRILERELTESGDMTVALLYLGPEREAVFLALGPLAPQDSAPGLQRSGSDPLDVSGTAAVTTIAAGERLHFYYPSVSESV